MERKQVVNRNDGTKTVLEVIVGGVVKCVAFLSLSVTMWSFVVFNTYKVVENVTMFGFYYTGEVLMSGMAIALFFLASFVEFKLMKWLWEYKYEWK